VEVEVGSHFCKNSNNVVGVWESVVASGGAGGPEKTAENYRT
jgi:hypothetical protein